MCYKSDHGVILVTDNLVSFSSRNRDSNKYKKTLDSLALTVSLSDIVARKKSVTIQTIY